MDDAFLVRGVERLGELSRNRESIGDRQRPARQPIGQGGTFDSSRTNAVTPSISSRP